MSDPENASERFERCRIEVRAADGSIECEDDDAEVRLDGDRLEILYWDDEGPVLFGGGVASDGSFELVCRSRPRTGTLAWASPGRRLAGEWRQGGESGRWEVELGSA